MTPTHGSLCTGIGGLDLAVEATTGARTAWHAEVNPHASRVLTERFPDVPNLGDITAIDWGQVEPVDILSGGTPCQDLSAAGKRAGMHDGTRSGLWASMVEAIRIIRPRLVIWENVRGALSADAWSQMEPCTWCVGGLDQGEPPLRALGRVLGDLADLGMDAVWTTLCADVVGAPHHRARVFVAAWPAGDPPGWIGQRGGRPGPEAGPVEPGVADQGAQLLPTPLGHDHKGRNIRGDASCLPGAVALLPTARATGGTKGGPNQRGSSGDLMLPSAVQPDHWGTYAEAITRWEQATRPAPEPRTDTGQLAAQFVEWMLGYEDGWTLPAGSRGARIQALGNSVQPQQGAEAVRRLLAMAQAHP